MKQSGKVKGIMTAVLLGLLMTMGGGTGLAAGTATGQGAAVGATGVRADGEALKLTEQWDKVFPQSRVILYRYDNK